MQPVNVSDMFTVMQPQHCNVHQCKYLTLITLSLFLPRPVNGDKIADFTALDSFLRGEEDREQRILRGSPDLGSPQTPTYWYGRQGSDYSPSPRKYHVASR